MNLWLERRMQADLEGRDRGALADADMRRRMLRRAVIFAVLGALLLVVVIVSTKLLLSGKPASWARTGWLLAVQFLVSVAALGWDAGWWQRAEARSASYAQAIETARRGAVDTEEVLRAARGQAVTSAVTTGTVFAPSMLVAFTWGNESVSWLLEVVVVVMTTGITVILMLAVTTPSRLKAAEKVGAPATKR